VRIDELGEFGLIARIADIVGTPGGAVEVGIGDDAAVLKIAGGRLVVSIDAFVEDQHFRRQWLTASQIGQRGTRAALSDVAAMGAVACAVLVSAGFLPGEDASYAEELLDGVHEAATAFGAALAGGDTLASSEGVSLDIVAVGEVDRPWLRSTAQAGDVIMVTGALGEAAAALHLLETGAAGSAEALPKALRDRFASPTPRFDVVKCLHGLPQTPCVIDISDGLVQDAGHIATASAVALTIHASHLPIAPPCRQVAADAGEDPLQWALSSGEEYELLLTIPGDLAEQAQTLAEAGGIELTKIGFVAEGQGVAVLDVSGQPIDVDSAGWDHFRRK